MLCSRYWRFNHTFFCTHCYSRIRSSKPFHYHRTISMKNYIQHHPWQIIEDGFHQEFHMVSESLYSLGNGRMGTRGNFEEQYSGETLRGSYFAGVYYPDLTRVGWWKNGYPEYFAKV